MVIWGCLFRGLYSASKGALGTTSEALRMEVKRFGVDVVTLAPGDYATDIAARRIYTPLKKESPYHDLYKISLDTIDEHVDQGSDPNDFARMVHKIIKLKKERYITDPVHFFKNYHYSSKGCCQILFLKRDDHEPL